MDLIREKLIYLINCIDNFIYILLNTSNNLYFSYKPMDYVLKYFVLSYNND